MGTLEETRKEQRGPGDERDGMENQDSGRMWAALAQEDGAVWEDGVSSWGQKWKQWSGVEKCPEGWMVPGRRGWRPMEQ